MDGNSWLLAVIAVVSMVTAAFALAYASSYRADLRETDGDLEEADERAIAIATVLTQVETGEFATASRDFGRGAAEVARRIRAVLEYEFEQ